MYKCVSILFFLLPHLLLAQNREQLKAKADSILAEGMALYELEYANSLSGTVLYERLSLEGIQGYFSYAEDDSVKTVYFQEGNKVKYTFSFPKPVDPQLFKIDGTERKMTKREKRLAKIRNNTLLAIREGSAFTKYSREEVSLNVSIVEKGKEYYSYVLPSPISGEYVPLGSDFLLVYKRSGKLKKLTHFHNNFIPVAIDSENKDEQVVSSFHKHLGETTEFITPTDICTLLLYKNIAQWDSHIVVSENFASFYSMKENKLQIITKEEMEKLVDSLGQ